MSVEIPEGVGGPAVRGEGSDTPATLGALTAMTEAADTSRRVDRLVPRLLRQHVFVALAVACLLAGTGFRYAAGTASGVGSSGGSAASTACAAK